ncbi:multinuclear nonheme iron-dependent oxidase, partial [Streptomyces sp. NPDC001274]
NHVNRGEDPATALDELPVEAIAYVHVAGGVEKDGVWHDTHAHPVTAPVLDVLAELRSRVDPPGVLLERDDAFPPAGELAGELDLIRATLDRAAGPPHRVPAARTPARAVPVEPSGTTASETAGETAARDRLATGQHGLLAALVAGGPVPAGFDRERLAVQSRALAAKRAGVVAKVAPELPEILGTGYRSAFLAYAAARPMSAGYRRDALDFAESLLLADLPADAAARRRLTHWWQDRAGARPPRRTTLLLRAARAALTGR